MDCPHCGKAVDVLPRRLNRKIIYETACRVAEEFNTGAKDILSKDRSIHVAAARWALWKIFRDHGYSYPEIARATGHDHSSVVHAKQQGWVPKRIAKRQDALKKIEARLA